MRKSRRLVLFILLLLCGFSAIYTRRTADVKNRVYFIQRRSCSDKLLYSIRQPWKISPQSAKKNHTSFTHSLRGTGGFRVKFHVVIPVCERNLDTFTAVLKSIKEAIKKVEIISIKVTVIEVCHHQRFKQLTADFGFDYIYLFSPKRSKFPKSLAYNLVFSLTQSEWYIFHDADVVVPVHFFSACENYVHKNRNRIWFQPYSGRLVRYLTPGSTLDYVTENYSNFTDLEIDKNKMQKGSPGGSIVVHSEAFCLIGGYDENLFSGYSPEDSFIWNKLSVLQAPSYLDTPNTILHHLNHKRTETFDGAFHQMMSYFRNFSYSSLRYKRLYSCLKMKQVELYGKCKNTLKYGESRARIIINNTCSIELSC